MKDKFDDTNNQPEENLRQPQTDDFGFEDEGIEESCCPYDCTDLDSCSGACEIDSMFDLDREEGGEV